MRNMDSRDVIIAEEFLRFKIQSIRIASEYSHYKSLLRAAQNCGVKHLPEEGVPFCAIDKIKLRNMSISLGRKKNKILTFIEKQIKTNSSDTELAKISNYIDTRNIKLMLKIGEFYDFITEISNDPFLIYLKNDKIVESYNNLPQKAYALLDPYLHKELNKLILKALDCGVLTPYSLHTTLEKLSKWIDISFLSINANFIKAAFIKTEDVSDLIRAFRYEYINESNFHERYIELSNDRSDKECLSDLHDCINYRFP